MNTQIIAIANQKGGVGNFYAVLKRQEMLDKEVYDIVHRNKKMAASAVRENRGKNCAAGKDKEKAVPRR